MLNIQEKNDATICIKVATASAITIGNSKRCFFYILQQMNKVTLQNLTECTVFISQSTNLEVINSGGVKVTAFIDNLKIRNSQRSTFYLFTLNPVVVTKKSVDIKLAPYNAAQNSFAIPSGNNLWDKYEMDNDCRVSLLPASEFTTFVLPFGSEPSGIPVQLPTNYSQALLERERVAEERRKLILEFCKIAPAYSSAMHERITNTYKEVVQSNNQQLQQLSNMGFY